MTILDEIRAHKEREVADRQTARPLGDLIAACGSAPAPRGFGAALRWPGLQLIAEVKRKSPAKGSLAPDVDAPQLAERYLNAGAAAVSVLTDEKFFSGSDADLKAVRERVDGPLLRKDFVITSYQIYEARSLGADAVLLIVSMLTDELLNTFLDTADCLGMDALVETHTEDEVRRAVALNAQIIGINNRDLSNFTVDLATTDRLRPLIPERTLVISESGISSRADVERVAAAGAKAILVGEALVTSADPGARIAELLGREAPLGRLVTVVKICGITDLANGLAAIDAGAEFLGFVFYPPSTRTVGVKHAAELIAELRAARPSGWQAVGVFVNEPIEVVESTRRLAGLDMVQLNGEETAEYIAQIDAPVIKAIRGGQALSEGTGVASSFGASRLLIDANVPGRYGGTGVTIDWEAVGPFVADAFLAGGLTPMNVGEAIRAARPWGLDVSSGVEANGVKDRALIEQFIENVRRVVL